MKLTFYSRGLDAALKKFHEQIEFESDLKLRVVALDLFNKIKQKTPVWTGSLRASWQISRHSPNLKTVTIPETAQGGPRSPGFQLGKSYAASLRPSKKMTTVWISNNLPYASVVEFGVYDQMFLTGQTHYYKVKGKYVPMIRTTKDGFSTQAPQGMVRVSILNITAKYRRP